MTRIAVMQPYFVPYAGYFRLFAAADLFLIFDDVQFPRRGWVHRNRLTKANGEMGWLTLPLNKAPRSVLIRELAFAKNAQAAMEERSQPFPALQVAIAKDQPLIRELFDVERPVVDHLVALLRTCCEILHLPFDIRFASEFDLEPEIKGAERIIRLVQAAGGDNYVNLPGGRGLYDAETFRKAGVDLRFLPEYQGSHLSILERLLTEPADAIRAEILDNISLQP